MRLPTLIASLACAPAFLPTAGTALAGPSGHTELSLSLQPASPAGCSDIAPIAGKPLRVTWSDYGAIIHGDGFDAYLGYPEARPRNKEILEVYKGNQKLGDSDLYLQLDIHAEGPALLVTTEKPACEWRGRAKIK